MFPCIAVKSYKNIVHGCNACFYVFCVAAISQQPVSPRYPYVFHMEPSSVPAKSCPNMPTLMIQTSANFHLFGLFVSMIEYDWYILWTCYTVTHVHTFWRIVWSQLHPQLRSWDKDPGSDDMLPATLLTQRFTTEKLWCDMWVSCFHHMKPRSMMIMLFD